MKVEAVEAVEAVEVSLDRVFCSGLPGLGLYTEVAWEGLVCGGESGEVSEDPVSVLKSQWSPLCYDSAVPGLWGLWGLGRTLVDFFLRGQVGALLLPQGRSLAATPSFGIQQHRE